MKYLKIFGRSLLIAGLVMLAGCGGSGDEDGKGSGNSADDPLVVAATDVISFSYSGTVGIGILYLKIVDLQPNDGFFMTTLSGMSDDADLYTYSDKFSTETCASTNVGTMNESCSVMSNQEGDIYIKVDGTKTDSGTAFLLLGVK